MHFLGVTQTSGRRANDLWSAEQCFVAQIPFSQGTVASLLGFLFNKYLVLDGTSKSLLFSLFLSLIASALLLCEFQFFLSFLKLLFFFFSVQQSCLWMMDIFTPHLFMLLLFVVFPPRVGHLCPLLDWAWLPECLEAHLRTALSVDLVFARLSGSSVIATER